MLLLWTQARGQDPAVPQAPPSRTAIEAERREAEEKIQKLQAQLEQQREELERQKASLSAIEARLKEGRGYVTKDEFAEYQKALSAFQKTLTEQIRKQEDIERAALNSRLKTEQAVFENGEATLGSLIANLSAQLNSANTARALMELPSPVAGSARYQAAVKSLEEQSRKSRIPSIAAQLAGAVPQVAWLNTAVSLVLSPAFKGKERDAHLKTLVCARDFADSVENARKARVMELDSLIERMGRLRERMRQTHDRMLALVQGPGSVRDQATSYFGSMKPRDGERPLQALSVLDERLRATRREVNSARALLADYRQLMDSEAEQQGRLREYILMHQKYACEAVETFQQDVSKALGSLEKARVQFKQMQADTEAMESVKVLDSVL